VEDDKVVEKYSGMKKKVRIFQKLMVYWSMEN
jgi:hypothetical protein